jgi:hypothetical protein
MGTEAPEDYIGRVIRPCEPSAPPEARRAKAKGTARKRFRLFNRFWRHPATPTLSHAEQAAWCYLWALADVRGLCFPSYARIAQRLGCNKRHARRLVARLLAAGFVVLVSRGSARRRQANCYRLVFPKARGAGGL